eukprot:Lithocolla_globosa_v1_NODE_8189_length_852_cov_2.473024.p2 type:complete len:112 gc:universal NODE_8189_length_852_cov_2.473024:819-484(-)
MVQQVHLSFKVIFVLTIEVSRVEVSSKHHPHRPGPLLWVPHERFHRHSDHPRTRLLFFGIIEFKFTIIICIVPSNFIDITRSDIDNDDTGLVNPFTHSIQNVMLHSFTIKP